ncbi:metalloprotease [Coemansia sp. RSA 1365]|nr:metalloprotease [Coemansia sp. RSA 1365]
MLSESGPQEWIYNEVSATPRLRFDYYEQPDLSDYVVDLSCDAINEYIPPEYIVSNGLVLSGFDSSLISAALELLNPTNYSLFIGAKSHEGIKLSNTEEYHNVRYHVSDLPNTLTTDFCQDKSMLSHFHLPKPNDFFPDDFSVPEPTGPRPKLDKSVPTLLKYNDCLELWYKQDDKFYVPKGIIEVEIKSSVINSSPLNRVMLDLLCAYWELILKQELYSSNFAGLSYSLYGSSMGINIIVKGFSQKLPLLLERIVSNMRHVVVKESKFNDCRDTLKEYFSYNRLASAISQASSWNANLLLYPRWHITLVEESLKDVTYEMLNNFLHTLFEQVHITMLVTGNFTEQQAMDTAFDVQNIINGQPLLSCEIPDVRLIQLDPGYYILPKMTLNGDTQNAVVANIQLGRFDDTRGRVIAIVFHKAFAGLFFNQLRTKEQLGYTVGSSIGGYENGNSQLTINVQGEYNPIYLSLRITEFLRTYRQYIIEFDEETFANTIKSLTTSFNAQITTISQESSRMWSSIESGCYDFEDVNKTRECLKTIGKQDIIEMWDTFINPDTAPQYTRTDIHIWSTSTQQPSTAELEKYPAGVLALQHLVKEGTNYDINLEKLDSFVKATGAEGSLDDAFLNLLKLYSAPQELAEQPSTDNSDDDSSSFGYCSCCSEPSPIAQKIKIGLQMALESAANPPDYHKHSTVNFANIGMCQTHEGIWVIDDISKFQRTQKLNRLSIPSTKLIPKYKD